VILAFVSGKTRAWLLLSILVLVCGSVLFAVIFYRSRSLAPAEMLKRLPTKDSLVLAVDFAALRRAGILQLLEGAKIDQEPDYVKFVAATDFNYAQDLDYALASFGPTGKYILARGRFDWKSLRTYAQAQGGDCYNELCRMPGSAPDRKISYLPLQASTMALAVTPDAESALLLNGPSGGPPVPPPDAAVWLYIPPAVLKSPGSLPEGTVLFAKSVDEAKSVVLSFSPDGDHVAGKLDVMCKSDADAAVTAAELNRITDVLRKLIAQTGQRPNPADLSGVLTAGAFENKGSQVLGSWPIQRVFVQKMLSGQ